MKGMGFKYTKEKLGSAVAQSTSIQGVARIILGKSVSGNQHQHIKRMIKKFGIDTNHFLGRGHYYSGKTSNRRKDPEQIFTIGKRQKSALLRRALLESSVEYKCIFCNINEWKGKKLNLEIDHIDGNSTDNSIKNLRFLCPNCHSQTNAFGFRKRNIK